MLHAVWTDDGKWSIILDIRATNGYSDHLEDLINDLSPNDKRALAAQLKSNVDDLIQG